MFSKEKILQEITRIRADFGFTPVEPVIRDLVYKEERGTLYIIAEDRVDKSNIIGYGKVVAELRKRLGVQYATVISNVDLPKRRKILTENLSLLKDDPVSVKLKKYMENERDMENDEITFPIEGKSLVVPCGNLHGIGLSRRLGFEPLVFTIRLTYPTLARTYESFVLEEKIENCDQCREITRKRAMEYAKKKSIPIVFGDFKEKITYNDTIMLNPTTFFWLNRWKRKNFTEKKERCIREKNNTFLEKILWEVHEGLCEPKWGSNDIYYYSKGNV